MFINIFFIFSYCYKGIKLATPIQFLLNFFFNESEYDYLKICIKKFDLFRNFLFFLFFFTKSVRKKNTLSCTILNSISFELREVKF